MPLYSDFNLSFEPDPITRDLARVEDDAAVVQSVKSLILTSVYERVFQPPLGSLVNKMLFEPIDKVTGMVLSRSIEETVRLYEPRAEVKVVNFYFNTTPQGEPIDPNALYVEITLRVKNSPNLVTTGVLLRRLR